VPARPFGTGTGLLVGSVREQVSVGVPSELGESAARGCKFVEVRLGGRALASEAPDAEDRLSVPVRPILDGGHHLAVHDRVDDRAGAGQCQAMPRGAAPDRIPLLLVRQRDCGVIVSRVVRQEHDGGAVLGPAATAQGAAATERAPRPLRPTR